MGSAGADGGAAPDAGLGGAPDGGGPAGGSGGGRGGGGRRFETRRLADEEFREVLRRNWWGTLAVPGDGAPYAVPVVYGWDGRHFHFISGDGEKVRRLEARPQASLTVVEVVGDGADWWSVVARGSVRFLEEDAEVLHAVRTLRRQRGHPGNVEEEALEQVARARVLRLEPDEVTGRTRA